MYGENIKKLREQHGLSQKDIVTQMRALGHKITPERYRRLEEDKSMLYLYDIAVLSEVLNTCPGILLSNCPYIPPTNTP